MLRRCNSWWGGGVGKNKRISADFPTLSFFLICSHFNIVINIQIYYFLLPVSYIPTSSFNVNDALILLYPQMIFILYRYTCLKFYINDNERINHLTLLRHIDRSLHGLNVRQWFDIPTVRKWILLCSEGHIL